MASPDSLFQQLLERMRYRSDRIARYVSGDTTHPRRWMIPPLNGWDGNPFEIKDMEKPFDRKELNETAQADFEDDEKGTTGLISGYLLQICYLAMMERSFRTRHMSPVRAMMHCAGRRKGHGHEEGIHTGDILNYIQDVLGSGG